MFNQVAAHGLRFAPPVRPHDVVIRIPINTKKDCL